MRNSTFLAIIVLFILFIDSSLALLVQLSKKHQEQMTLDMHTTVGELGLSDLCLTTEARYTRHPAISDSVVPFMDHPMDIEHFPSGSFFRPPTHLLNNKNDFPRNSSNSFFKTVTRAGGSRQP